MLCPKFHLNRFTSGGGVAERVNTVQKRHKVFPILGEATPSSPSNKAEVLGNFLSVFTAEEEVSSSFIPHKPIYSPIEKWVFSEQFILDKLNKISIRSFCKISFLVSKLDKGTVQ